MSLPTIPKDVNIPSRPAASTQSRAFNSSCKSSIKCSTSSTHVNVWLFADFKWLRYVRRKLARRPQSRRFLPHRLRNSDMGTSQNLHPRQLPRQSEIDNRISNATNETQNMSNAPPGCVPVQPTDNALLPGSVVVVENLPPSTTAERVYNLFADNPGILSATVFPFTGANGTTSAELYFMQHDQALKVLTTLRLKNTISNLNRHANSDLGWHWMI